MKLIIEGRFILDTSIGKKF